MESSGVGLFSCEHLVYEDWPTFGRKPGTRGQDGQPPPAARFIATRIPGHVEKGWDTEHKAYHVWLRKTCSQTRAQRQMGGGEWKRG